MDNDLLKNGQLKEKVENVKKFSKKMNDKNSISRKLWKSFWTIAGISGVIILISMAFLINISSAVKVFQDSAYAATDNAWDAKRILLVVQNNLFMATNTFDPVETQNYLKLAEEASSRLLTITKELEEANIATEDNLSKIYALSDNMTATRTQMMENAALNTEEGNAEAIRIMMEEYVPDAELVGEILTKIGDYANAAANKFVKDASFKAGVCIAIVIVMFIANLIFIVMNAKYLVKKITLPLIEIEDAVTELANGNLEVSIAYESKDEFGILADNLRNTITELRKYISNITSVLETISDKNMNTEITIDYKGNFKPLKESINYIITFLNEMIYKIREASSEVTQGANQMAEASQLLATGAGEQASSVEELLATINEVSEAVDINANSAKEVKDLSGNSGKEISKGNEYMRELLKSMEKIAEQSNQVASIVKVIDEISSQTNLLSLNASIEAARAGEHGAGFAVVANEIGKLASESAEAAKNSTELIGKTLHIVEQGSKITDETAEIFEKIVESSKETDKLVGDIALACTEQAESLNEILRGIQQIADITASNSSTAEETSASSEELLSESEMLYTMLEEYKIKS